MVFLNLKRIVLFKFVLSSILLIPSNLFASVDAENTYEKTVNTDNTLLIKKSLDSQYIIGPGDRINIQFDDLNEFSGVFLVGPTGEIFLPEIGSFQVKDKTIERITKLLEDRYSSILKEPSFTLTLVGYRPIDVTLAGELKRPGQYILSGLYDESPSVPGNLIVDLNLKNSQVRFPKILDALRLSGGITLYSDLTNIEIIRRRPTDNGVTYMSTSLNLLPEVLGQNLDISQNIRLMDGDTIKINKTKNVLYEQMSRAIKTNINPSKINIFISGQAVTSGSTSVPVGSSMNQAIASSGGKKIFSGKIHFIRYESDGSTIKRKFRYQPNANQGSVFNPILLSGDIIHVTRTPLGYASEAISTVAAPVFGLYSLVNLVNDVISKD